jgi:hypothetical protein
MANYEIVGANGAIYLATEDIAEARDYKQWLESNDPTLHLPPDVWPFQILVEVTDRAYWPQSAMWMPVDDNANIPSEDYDGC